MFCYRKQPKPCWNDMEELKYLICAIDCCKCPIVCPQPVCNIILPPRIQEMPSVVPPQRIPCCPPPPCVPPITPGPCCPSPLPPPVPPKPPMPRQPKPCCPPCCPLPCYPSPIVLIVALLNNGVHLLVGFPRSFQINHRPIQRPPRGKKASLGVDSLISIRGGCAEVVAADCRIPEVQL